MARQLGALCFPAETRPNASYSAPSKNMQWGDLWIKLGRSVAIVIGGCERAMTLGDHHDWVQFAADYIRIGGTVSGT
jgi:hypothetical protein